MAEEKKQTENALPDEKLDQVSGGIWKVGEIRKETTQGVKPPAKADPRWYSPFDRQNSDDDINDAT